MQLWSGRDAQPADPALVIDENQTPRTIPDDKGALGVYVLYAVGRDTTKI